MAASSSTSSSKLQFALRLLYVVAAIFLLDLAVGKTLEHLYFTQKSGLNYRTTYAIRSAEPEILIIGNSRANHHYIPDIITAATGSSCYNAGRDGQSLPYYLAIYKAITSRYTPSIVILDLPGNMTYRQKDFDSLSVLLPYYSTNKELQPYMDMRSKLERLKLYTSCIYPYNSLALTIAKYQNESAEQDYRGYIPIYRTMDSTKSLKPISNLGEVKASKEYLNMLTEILSDAQKRKIQMLVVISPRYCADHECREINPHVDIVKELAKNNGAVFLTTRLCSILTLPQNTSQTRHT